MPKHPTLTGAQLREAIAENREIGYIERPHDRNDSTFKTRGKAKDIVWEFCVFDEGEFGDEEFVTGSDGNCTWRVVT